MVTNMDLMTCTHIYWVGVGLEPIVTNCRKLHCLKLRPSISLQDTFARLSLSTGDTFVPDVLLAKTASDVQIRPRGHCACAHPQ